MSPTAVKFYFCLLAFALGAVVGSFLNVVIWRLPRGEKLSYPGSHCPKCNHKILPYENIPILSWLCLRGRCSSCRLPISWRYPAGEAATGMLYTWILLHILNADLPVECALGAFWLAGSLLAAAIIDGEHKFIPNKVTYSGLIAALALAIALPSGRYGLAYGATANIIFGHVAQGIKALTGFSIETNPTAAAVLDCLLGAAVSFCILGLFTIIGNIVTRPQHRLLKKPATAVITQDGIQVADIWAAKWEDIITSATCTMTAIAEITGGWKQVPKGTKGPLKINADGLSINGTRLDWEYVNKIELNVTGWSCPRTIMGAGDLKLMTMIGAFLGADAAIYILFCGAVIGAGFGFFRMLCTIATRNQRTAANIPLEIPFGPFLAIPALVWLIFFA